MTKPSRPFLLTLVLIFIAFAWAMSPWGLRSFPPDPALDRCRSELQRLWFALEVYRAEFGQQLSRNTSDTLDMLAGGNAEHRRFLDRHSFRTSPAGTCLDPWGTPYRIATEGKLTKLRSAGPDGIMFTPDDPIVE